MLGTTPVLLPMWWGLYQPLLMSLFKVKTLQMSYGIPFKVLFFFLLLPVPPNIISPAAGFTYTVNSSDPVTFQCTASGIPPPLITFYNSYGPLSSDMDPRVILSDPIIGSVTIGQQTVSTTSRNLTINSTRDGDSGNYTCVTFNNRVAIFYSNQTFRLIFQCMPP